MLFIEYAINDAVLLPLIYNKKLENFNKVISQLIPNNPGIFDYNKFPTTIGTVVFQIYNTYLNQVVFTNNLAFKIALFKQGTLNPLHP